MRPKKIYLNPKTIEQLTPYMADGKTMRVRAFKGKDDAEYTDLPQVWHGMTELPEVGKPVLVFGHLQTENGQLAEARVSVVINAGVFESCETGFWHSVPEDAEWAYIEDLTPKEYS